MKLFIAFIVTILSFGYLLPWMVAWSKGRSNASAIGMLNLLTGWTFIGWVGALIWAMTDSK